MVARIFLAVFAIGPREHDTAAGLAIGHQHGREFADCLHVERTERAAAGIRDDAGIGIDLADFGVPQAPEIQAAVAAAREYRRGAPGLADHWRSREIKSGRGLEIVGAMLAINIARNRPSG